MLWMTWSTCKFKATERLVSAVSPRLTPESEFKLITFNNGAEQGRMTGELWIKKKVECYVRLRME